MAGRVSDEKSDLVACAACGDEEAIRLLMEDTEGIFDVANGGYIGLLRRLVGEKGADVDAADENGYTAVIWASNGGHLECVKYLVGEKGADVDTASKDGATAVMIASKAGHLEVVEYLKSKGASLSDA